MSVFQESGEIDGRALCEQVTASSSGSTCLLKCFKKLLCIKFTVCFTKVIRRYAKHTELSRDKSHCFPEGRSGMLLR